LLVFLLLCLSPVFLGKISRQDRLRATISDSFDQRQNARLNEELRKAGRTQIQEAEPARLSAGIEEAAMGGFRYCVVGRNLRSQICRPLEKVSAT
jgi:hypothetical protein